MEINFDNNVLAEIQVENNLIKVTRAMDGWGKPIDISKITIDGKKQDEMITISKKEYDLLKRDSYTLWNCVDQ